MEHNKKVAYKKDILNVIQVNGKEECFTRLKDHKLNFENNANTRLINSAKHEIGRLSKAIVENINKQLRNTLYLQKWNNFENVIENKNPNKNKYKFMIFNIQDLILL